MKKVFVSILCILLLAGCSGPETETEDVPVYERKDLSSVTSIKGLDQAEIAIRTQAEEELLKQAGEVKTFYYDSADMEVTVVKAEAIDGALMKEPLALSYCAIDQELSYLELKNNGNGFEVDPLTTDRVALLKKNSSLTAGIDELLAELSAQDRLQLMKEVLRVRNGQPVDHFVSEVVPPEETKGTIRVGIENTSSFNWTDEEEPSFGSFVLNTEEEEEITCNGYDVQLAQYLANSLGYRLEVYMLDQEGLLEALNRSSIDVAFGDFTAAEATDTYDVTSSCLDVNYVILYKK